MKPVVSVILTTFRRPSLLKEAVNSVLSQTLKEFELIIVDDNSGDETPEVVNSFQDPRIRYTSHDKNKRLASARNTGLRKACGRYVAFLDDDDSWLPKKLELQIRQMNLTDSANTLCYCGLAEIKDGEVKISHSPKIHGRMDKIFFSGDAGIPSSSILVERSSVLKVGGFSENLVSCIDHDFFMKLAFEGFILVLVPHGLVYYRKRKTKENMMGQLPQRLKGIEQFFNKWKDPVIGKTGLKGWKAIETLYYQQTVDTILIQCKNKSLKRSEAKRFFLNILKTQTPPRCKVWFDYSVFFFDYRILLARRWIYKKFIRFNERLHIHH